tara:strand:+ start:47335 stop:47607 length:273 start_codon:yes stop_codon:yes gene_type:complete
VWIIKQDLIFGLDSDKKEQIKIETGGTHWKFNFTQHSGSGKVRIGRGCNYNPLNLIQDMFFHVKTGIQMPVMDIDFNDIDLSSDFKDEWE